MGNRVFVAESRAVNDKVLYLIFGKRADFREKDVVSSLVGISGEPIVPVNGGILAFEDGGLLVTGVNEYRRKVLMPKTAELHEQWREQKAVRHAAGLLSKG